MGSLLNFPCKHKIKTQENQKLQKIAKMFTPWHTVRPSFWYPMASLEQSMMDMERMADEMFLSRYPMRSNLLSLPVLEDDDDDFFKDLPMNKESEEKKKLTEEKQKPAQEKGHRAYSNYSYSSSSVVDEKGQRVESKRRRYEDSTGRLKAVHTRQMGDKVLKTSWSRQNKDDEGKHEQICSSGDPSEFEKLWGETPFGKAHTKKLEEGLKEDTPALKE